VIGTDKMLEINRVLEINKGHVLIIQADTILKLARDSPGAHDINARHNEVLLCMCMFTLKEQVFVINLVSSEFGKIHFHEVSNS